MTRQYHGGTRGSVPVFHRRFDGLRCGGVFLQRKHHPPGLFFSGTKPTDCSSSLDPRVLFRPLATILCPYLSHCLSPYPGLYPGPLSLPSEENACFRIISSHASSYVGMGSITFSRSLEASHFLSSCWEMSRPAALSDSPPSAINLPVATAATPSSCDLRHLMDGIGETFDAQRVGLLPLLRPFLERNEVIGFCENGRRSW